MKAVVDMTCTTSACPVQYEGTVNGKQAYYRARSGGWRFEIYEGEFMKSREIFVVGGDITAAYGLSRDDFSWGETGRPFAEMMIQWASQYFTDNADNVVDAEPKAPTAEQE